MKILDRFLKPDDLPRATHTNADADSDDVLFASAQMDPAIVREAGITNGMSAAEIRRRILEVARAR